MNILDRYIARVVLIASLLVLLVIVALDSLFTLVTEFGDVGRGSYGILNVLEYLLLTMPHRVYELLPMAALLGSLLGLGMLASHRELVVMRAAGVSLWRLVQSVLYVGVVLMFVGILIGEFIAPVAEKLAQTRRAMLISEHIILRSDYGFWARDANRFVNIRQVLPGGKLGDLYIYEYDDDMRLQSVTHAVGGEYRDGRWLLEQVDQSEISAGQVSTRQLARSEWTSILTPDLLNVVSVSPTDLSAQELGSYIGYLRDNHLDTGSFELAYWGRLAWPLTGLVMIFLSVPFVFGPLRETGAGQRLLVGAMVGIGFYLINKTVGQLSLIYGVEPMVSTLLPLAAFAAAGAIGLSRVR
jgi:lipopolysaccharide export system permease protein